VLGTSERAPRVEELANALAESADACLVVCLAALGASHRLPVFKEMLARVNESRATLGRPHWLVVGEAHRMFPASDADPLLRPQAGGSTLMCVSVHPEQVARPVLDSVSLVLAMGRDQEAALRHYCAAVGGRVPAVRERPAEDTEAIGWFTRAQDAPIAFRIASPQQRKGAAPAPRASPGDLPPERSFYFRGPQRKQNLRAQNLQLFVQIGRGVDDETWLYHLRERDYSRWLRTVLGEDGVSARVAAIEAEGGSAERTRERIAAAIEAFLGDCAERR